MNWCCAQWIDLGQEMADAKVLSLEKLLKKGIPRSTFSSIYRILEGVGNYCPCCGTSLSTTAPKQKEQVAPPPVSKVSPSIKCPPCRGTGKVGDGLNCMTCLGLGVLDKSNPSRAKYDPVYAEEINSKLEENNRRIVNVEKEIQKNPKPLRDDARPENWVR
jgi:hypothetical protein